MADDESNLPGGSFGYGDLSGMQEFDEGEVENATHTDLLFLLRFLSIWGAEPNKIIVEATTAISLRATSILHCGFTRKNEWFPKYVF